MSAIREETIAAIETAESSEIESGNLEDRVRLGLLEIDGVTSVQVTRLTKGFMVDVEIKALEFDLFERVSQVELELFAQYPDLDIRFDITPERLAATLPVDAAA